jgi:hypothetical protein
MELEYFIAFDDIVKSKEISIEQENWSLVKYRFVNNYMHTSQFHDVLSKYDFANYDNFRPRWDTYFMKVALVVAI